MAPLGHDKEAVPLGTRTIGQQHRVFVERGLNFFAVQRVHPQQGPEVGIQRLDPVQQSLLLGLQTVKVL
jgi:hypothetical protein